MVLLGSYFLTGNKTEQARDLFDDLQMGEEGHANETFLEFKARFQSAVITGQVTDHTASRFCRGSDPESPLRGIRYNYKAFILNKCAILQTIRVRRFEDKAFF
ncbi:hypothetical protein VF21_10298 [Pseudogymnoascus sp. 05NY08]|nr:hypothetical protein VF21_10298 [Pseudogymnoascus sp. 05NY08]